LGGSVGVGNEPVSIAVADVNGDGKPDMISANYGNSTLTVLTNNGSGGVLLAATLSVGNGPESVVAATNLYNHGEVDLISANYGDSTLTVLTNSSSGGFALAAILNVGSGPFSVTAVDVNGDGKPDLISANYNDNTLTVLLNTPMINGNFTGAFTGSGAGLTGLNPANIGAGTAGINISGNAATATTATNALNFSGSVLDSQLTANIPRINGTNTFTGTNTFNSPVIMTNQANRIVIENRSADPSTPVTGQIWLITP
jgi:hypothetical protein